jgi:hypothetical protein
LTNRYSSNIINIGRQEGDRQAEALGFMLALLYLDMYIDTMKVHCFSEGKPCAFLSFQPGQTSVGMSACPSKSTGDEKFKK